MISLHHGAAVRQPALPLSNVSTRFGCRLAAFALPDDAAHNKSLDVFHKQALITGENSLKAQSRPNRPERDGIRQQFNIEDLVLAPLRKNGNNHGWGITTHGGKSPTASPWQSRETTPAYSETAGYDQAVTQALANKPNFLLSHVRAAAAECKQVIPTNNHPFTYGPWSLMHNGVVQSTFEPEIQRRIKALLPANDQPKGTTDSETALYYFMGLLKNTYGSVDTKQIGKENVRKAFAKAVDDLVSLSPAGFKKLDGQGLFGIQGELEYTPLANFVACDGNMLLAFRKGPTMVLGMRPTGSISTGNTQLSKEFIVASEPFQPQGRGQAKIQWLQIPDNTIVTLSKNPDGSLLPEMHSLSVYTRTPGSLYTVA